MNRLHEGDGQYTEFLVYSLLHILDVRFRLFQLSGVGTLTLADKLNRTHRLHANSHVHTS